VRSVCLVTKGEDLSEVKRISLDTSSKTSVALTKIVFREFLGHEPEWQEAAPNINEMLESADAALIIGDPALRLSSDARFRSFDLAELWRHHTGFGFVFAMWMTRRDKVAIDFASARDEGIAHIDEIAANYSGEIGLDLIEMKQYLSQNIAYSVDEEMRRGMELYFDLAHKHSLIRDRKPTDFAAIN
jgi:chorismate dehydratase